MNTYTEDVTASVVQLPFEPLPNIYVMDTDDGDLIVTLPPPSPDDATIGVINAGSGTTTVVGTLADNSTYEMAEQYQTAFFTADEENGVWRLTSSAGAPAGSAATRFVALISQSGSSNPVATVLENTTGGTFTFTRESQGVYKGVIAGTTIPFAKTTILMGAPQPNDFSAFIGYYVEPNETDEIYFYTVDIAADGTAALTDGMTDNLTLDMRIYP